MAISIDLLCRSQAFTLVIFKVKCEQNGISEFSIDTQPLKITTPQFA